FADPRGARLPRRTSTMEAPQTLITVMRHAVGRPSLVFRCCGPPPGTAAIAAKAAYLRGTVSSKPRRGHHQQTKRSLVRIDRRGGGPWVWTWRRLPGVETPVTLGPRHATHPEQATSAHIAAVPALYD